MGFVILFMGCLGGLNETKKSPATCEEAREDFLEFETELLEGLDYKSCSEASGCDIITCRDICGVSCYILSINRENYSSVKQQVEEYASEHCQVCADYVYEIYPEPELPPPSCVDGECGY